nr:MAG TPA: alpha-aminoadipate carrier protein [Caudoviricetes sp.]
MSDSSKQICPTCGAVAQFSWHGNSPFLRYGSLNCPARHHSVSVTYQKDSMKAARASLIRQWSELRK